MMAIRSIAALSMLVPALVVLHVAQADPRTARQSTGESGRRHLSGPACAGDARQLVELLELSHPDPYTPMGGKVAFKRRAWRLVRSLPKRGMTVDTLGQVLQSFLAGLNDGHTRLQQNISWGAPGDALPVLFDVSERGLHVAGADLPALDGTRGFLLRGVNGVPVRELESRLSRLVPFENPYHGHAMLRRAVVSPILLGHLLPRFDPRGGITYELLAPAGVQTSRKLGATKPPASRGTWRTPPNRWDRVTVSDEPFSFRLLDQESIAYFRVASVMGREAFEMAWRYNMGDPKAWLGRYYQQHNRPMPDDIAQAIQGIPSFLDPAEQLLRQMKRRRTRHLIVDLRGNGGGMTPTLPPFLYMLFGDTYFKHRFPNEFITIVSQLYLDKFHRTLEAERRSRKDPTLQVGDYVFRTAKQENPRARRRAQIAEYRQKKMSFAGRLERLQGRAIYTPETIVALCDAGTYSAAFHFMYFLRDMGATVVGVPSSQAPNAPMEMTPFTLPKSGLQGSVSNSAQIFLPQDPSAKFLAPDFQLSYATIQRYQFEQDAALHYAFDLIREGKIKGRRPR